MGIGERWGKGKGEHPISSGMGYLILLRINVLWYKDTVWDGINGMNMYVSPRITFMYRITILLMCPSDSFNAEPNH